MKSGSTIVEDRKLTASELAFTRWLLSNSNERAQSFLSQLQDVRVAGRCACGCASIDLSVGGISHHGAAGMEILGDYQWRSESDALFGVYVYAVNGLLAGVDLWSIDGSGTATVLPSVDRLKPL